MLVADDLGDAGEGGADDRETTGKSLHNGHGQAVAVAVRTDHTGEHVKVCRPVSFQDLQLRVGA